MPVLLRIIGSVLIIIVCLGLLLFIYFRWYQKKGIYFPVKGISSTPGDIGLDYQDIFINTSDGVKIHGWFVSGQKKDMTVLFLHGNAGNISHRLPVIEMINKLGINIFIIDWRGYGKSSGVPSEEGFYKDAKTAMEYLTGQRGLPSDKIVVYGKSLGASIAVDLVSAGQAGGLIFDSGITSAEELAEYLYPYLPVSLFVSVKYDALSKIGMIECPKLIVHAVDDEMVPFKMAERIYKKAAQPKRIVSLRGGHNNAIFEDKEVFISNLEEFLNSLYN